MLDKNHRGDRGTLGVPLRAPAQLFSAEIIGAAHEHGRRRWSLTLFFADLVRLNVGAVHVAVLLPEVLFLVVDPSQVDDQLRADLGPRVHQQTPFHWTGPALELYLPVEDTAALWPRLRAASRASSTPPRPETLPSGSHTRRA